MGPDFSDGPHDIHSGSVNACFPFSSWKYFLQDCWRCKSLVLRACESEKGIKSFLFGMFWSSWCRKRSQFPAASSWNWSAALLVRKAWSLCSSFFFVIRVSFKTYNKWCCQEIFFCSASGHCCSIWENRAACYWSWRIADFSVWQQNWKIKWKKGFTWFTLECYLSC